MISWSASRIDVANYCRMRYYLRYVENETPLRLSAYAKGSLLHELIEKFWDKLGTLEGVVKKSSKKKYFDALGFAKYAQGLWMRRVIASENSKNPIYWKDNGEKWSIKSGLEKICIPLFSHLLNEGPPIFSELGFNFVLRGKKFRGRIDEVRKRNGQIVIRDYKSGKPWLGEMKLNHDPQLTLYNAGLCALCYADANIAEKLNLMNIRKEFMGNPIYVNPNFIEEFFMIEALSVNSEKVRTVPCAVHTTTRRNEHFFELLKMIDGTQTAVALGGIYPERGRKCDDCDMKIACGSKLNDVGKGEFTNKEGQIYFNFAFPNYIKKSKYEIKAEEEKAKKQQIKLKLRRNLKNN